MTIDATLPNTSVPTLERKRAVPGWVRRSLGWFAVLMVAGTTIGAYRLFVPIKVIALRVERGAVAAEVFGRGTVESGYNADLGFDLVGTISEMLVDEGDRVKRGQELARLAPEQVQADLRAAVTNIGATRSALQRLAADERRALTALDAAKREAARTEQLAPAGLISIRENDIAHDQVRLAQAELDRVNGQRVEILSGVNVASRSAEQRRTIVQRSTLLAPFDGLVTRRLRDPGNTVNVGNTVLRIVDTEHVYVRAWIDETMTEQLRERQEAELLFPGSRKLAFAKIMRLGGESDRQTHELLVDLRPSAISRRVSIGQRVDVWIRVSVRESVVRVAPAFVRHDGNKDWCVVDRGGRTQTVKVKLGQIGRDWIEVKEGLRDGDTVLRTPEPAGLVPVGRRWKAIG